MPIDSGILMSWIERHFYDQELDLRLNSYSCNGFPGSGSASVGPSH